jgi:hypothetical protein
LYKFADVGGAAVFQISNIRYRPTTGHI